VAIPRVTSELNFTEKWLLNDACVCNEFSDRNAKRAEIVYDVFLPDANFRKSNPGQPAVCLCVARLVAQLYFIHN